MDLDLRCYAYSDGESWEAICTDLDIATFGPSLETVKESLFTCIELHLESLRDLPVADQHRLLSRKAPWWVRAKLAAAVGLSQRLGQTKPGQKFTIQSPNPLITGGTHPPEGRTAA